MDLKDCSCGLIDGDRRVNIDIAGVIEVHSVWIGNIVVGLLVLLMSLLLNLLNTAALVAETGKEAFVPFIAVEA
jgi:hypothetical protein